MPQVAARINEQQERWLKDYFRTKLSLIHI